MMMPRIFNIRKRQINTLNTKKGWNFVKSPKNRKGGNNSSP